MPAAGEVVGVMLREGKLSPLAIAWLATRAHVLFGSAEQRQRSGLPRDRDPLTRELREILGAKPRASTDEVIEALRRRAGAGSPIEDVNDDGTVTWFEAHELREATRKNIAKRISRLRPRTR